MLEKGSKGQPSPWCCVAFKCSHKMTQSHISSLSLYVVCTTPVHVAQNLESGPRSDLESSLLKLKPERSVMMQMWKEKHIKRFLLRNSSYLRSSYMCAVYTAYSLFPFMCSWMIYTLTDLHFWVMSFVGRQLSKETQHCYSNDGDINVFPLFGWVKTMKYSLELNH